MNINEIDFQGKFQAVLIRQNISTSVLTDIVSKLVGHYGKYLRRITVNPTQISEVTGLVPTPNISLGTVVGYPLGNLPQEVKAIQIKSAKETGADHVDIVLPIEYLIDNQPNKAREEILALTAICKEQSLTAAWIANLAFLSDAQKMQAAQIIAEAGTPLITNSGFNNQTVSRDIYSLKAHTPDLTVTVCGGVESAEQTIAFLSEGAELAASHNLLDLLGGLEALLTYME